MRLRAEFTVEPFVAGQPGRHVVAAIEAAGSGGLAVDVGPLGSTIEGDATAVLDAVDRAHRAALAEGAGRIIVQVSRLDPEGT